MSESQNANLYEQCKILSDKALEHRLPRWEDLPELELYMDQVVAVMERYLKPYISQTDENRIITPAIINNYVKLKVIPPPVKKKYSKEHLAYLIIICILKQTLSISTILRIIGLQLKLMGIAELYNSFCNTYETVLGLVVSESTSGLVNQSSPSPLPLDVLILRAAIVSTTGRFVCENLLSFAEHAGENKGSEPSNNQKDGEKANKPK